MNVLPEWATEPPFNPEREWLPIVCTGYTDEGRRHPAELVGIYFDGDGWGWRGRPDKRENLQVAHIMPTSVNRVFTYDNEGNVIGSRAEGRGSIRVDCPACARVHRLARGAWEKWLEAARVSGAPWADVAPLD